MLVIVAVTATSSKSGISTGAIVGIVLGAIACAVTLSAIVTLLLLRTKFKDYRAVSNKRRHGEFLIMNEQVYCYFVPYQNLEVGLQIYCYRPYLIGYQE